MDLNGNGHDGVRPVPEEALRSLGDDIARAGGEWHAPEEDAGAVGRTMFDTPASADGTVTVLLPRDSIAELQHQSLVRIESRADGRSYVGAVVHGPFAEPDGLRADAPIIVTTTVRGGPTFMPKYHGRAQVEIIGEELDHGALVPPRRRPLPNSPVFVLPPGETARVLRTAGAVRLGVAEAHESIEIRVPADSKAVFPRHLGILGTTGGGKSTTVSGLVAQLQKAGMATIILDTEGEYTAICDPTDHTPMQQALARRDLAPAGVPDTHVYRLVGRDTRNPGHTDQHEFTLRFSELSPYAVMDILELPEAQEQRYLKAYDACKRTLYDLKVFPRTPDEQVEAIELDEFERGYPRMRLDHIYDVVRMAERLAAGEPLMPLVSPALRGQEDVIARHLGKPPKQDSVPSWRALLGKLGRLRRLKVFDMGEANALSYADLARPGRVSIVDLSDTDSPQLRNLAIAELLRGVHQWQEEEAKRTERDGGRLTPVMVFIEEAHEFLSATRIAKMRVLFEQVARIARRGRKRWLGLVFVTQLPQHLPDEVLGLINNWVLHKINDAGTINRLRRSIGGIDEGLWERLPALAPGQAIVSFTSLSRPLLVAVDPTPCRLLLVD